MLEHLVDTVLYFEGERSHQFRILRAVKNRFGPTDEIGVFEMASEGLVEVENPSALFLAQRNQDAAGSSVLAALEGTRPILVEVEALVAPSSLGSPRRAVLGRIWNCSAMIVAVLETRCGLQLSGVRYLPQHTGHPHSGTGGLATLLLPRPLSVRCRANRCRRNWFFGEIGLAGEVRGRSPSPTSG